MQGLERIADASLAARAAWAAMAIRHIADCGLPSVRLPLGALMAYPVGFDAASASDLAGIQPCLAILLPIPLLDHRVLAV